MIYVAFSEDLDNFISGVTVFSVNTFYEFTDWFLNRCDPKEIYVSEKREDILKYIDRMVD